MTCPATADECICQLEVGHGDTHECSCGGMWRHEYDQFVVVRLPGAAGEKYGGDVVGALLGFMGIDDEDDD